MKFFASQLNYLLEKNKTRRNLRSLGKFLLVLLVIIITFSVSFHGIMVYEGKQHSWLTGLYWTLTVMSTLGFGDITFESDVGRVFSVVVLITGVILLLIMLPFAFIRFFYAPWMEAQLRSQAAKEVPPNTSGHVLLCSWDSLTQGVADRLALLNIPYFVIEPDPVRAAELHLDGIPVVRGELDESETYTSARVGQARAVFASLDDPTNTSIILTALEACPTVQILALAEHEESVDLLELAGASHVLSLKQRLGEQLANRAETRYSSAHVIGQFEDLFIAEFLVYRTPLVGKTLVDAQLRQATGVNVVGVWERGRLQQAGPKTLLRDSSIPVVVGTQGQIDALENQIRSEVENGHPVIVVGAGRVGRATAEALLRKGLHVHLLDRDPNVIAQMQPFEGETFVGEGADRALLMRAGVKNASSVVLTTNDDATNIYLSIYFRKLNPDLIIVARITHERNIESIHRAGADFVLSYSSLGQESVMAIVQKREFVFLGGDVDFYVFPVPALLAGTTLRTSGIGARTGLNIIGVRQADGLHNPGPDTSLADGATLIAIGTPKQRSEFKKVFE